MEWSPVHSSGLFLTLATVSLLHVASQPADTRPNGVLLVSDGRTTET
jgi:hypothetical protein